MLRLAAYAVAAGLVWRYIVVPFWRRVIVGSYRGFRNFFRRAKALTAEVETIRALAAETHAVTQRELTKNGGGSAVDKLDALVQQIGVHDERLHVIGELFTAHLADGELRDHHLKTQLAEKGIDITPLQPRERWQWINRPPKED